MAGVGKTIDEVASSVLETAANVAQDVLESETAGKVFDTVENTMLPYLMGAASFAYGVVFPEGGQPPTIGGATSNVVVPANSGRRGSSGMSFFYGIIVGMGLSRELYRRRIVDKMRLALYAWLYDDEADSTEVDEEEERSTKFREPVQMDTLEGLPMPGSERDDVSGILKEMVSPEWALTSNLHIALITLPFGSELVPAKSGGVEFYYVISGEGTYTRGDTVDKYNENTVTITTGSGFLVDPEVLRGFAAKGKGQVVLLRATDAAVMEGYDVLAGQSNSSSRALLGAGLGKIEEMYKKYSQNSDGYEILKTSGN